MLKILNKILSIKRRPSIEEFINSVKQNTSLKYFVINCYNICPESKPRLRYCEFDTEELVKKYIIQEIKKGEDEESFLIIYGNKKEEVL